MMIYDLRLALQVSEWSGNPHRFRVLLQAFGGAGTHLSHDVRLAAHVSVALQKTGLSQHSRAADGVLQGVTDAQAMLEVHRQLSQALNGHHGDEPESKMVADLTR